MIFSLLAVLLIILVYTKNLRNLEDLSDDIVIIHVNDVHCGLNDTIGYDGYKLYKDELKEKYKNVITVDAGDHVQGGTLGAISDGTAIIDLMNKLEFDVAILGNREFDYGIEKLNQLGEDFKSNYTCANFCYRKNKTTIFDPYKIIEVGGKKVGFIGVLTPLTLSKTYLSSVLDDDGSLLYDFLTGNNTQELYDTVQNHIDYLRNNESVDYVILLTHMGLKREQYTSDGLLSNLKNVTAILDAHTHQIYNITSKDKDGKEIHVTQTGTKLARVGLLILKKDGTIISENIEEIPEPLNKTNAKQVLRSKTNRWVDKETSEFINSLWDRYKEELGILLGHSDFDMIVAIPSGESSLMECRFKECTLGNLVADAVRDMGNGEIAIINGGAVRNNMLKGELTRGKVIEVLPWFNNIIQKQFTGQTILDALEFGVSKLPELSGGFPQVSGITFDVDSSINSTVQTDASGMFVGVAGKRRVSNVKINGEDLNLSRIYNASMIEFTAGGGDGYSMFAKYNVTNESLVTDTDALCMYIQNNLNGTIPEKYKSYQGRINIYNKSSSSPLPDIFLLGFDQYKEFEEQNKIQFLAYIMIRNYLKEIKNMTLKTIINYNDKLRVLEEEVISMNCEYQSKKNDPEIYTFLCSKELNNSIPISKINGIKYESKSIKINNEEVPNLESSGLVNTLGENIKNQGGDIFSCDTYILDNSYLRNEDTTILIEGENNDNIGLTSNASYLLFNHKDNKLKNISCNIQEGNGKNIYRIICNPHSSLNADLNHNNLVQLKDRNKNLIINFNDPNNSTINSTVESFKYFKTKKSNSGLSAGGIIAIIFSLVAALGIVGAVFFLFRNSPPNVKTSMNPSDSKINIHQ